jgi:hypothetical protein
LVPKERPVIVTLCPCEKPPVTPLITGTPAVPPLDVVVELPDVVSLDTSVASADGVDVVAVDVVDVASLDVGAASSEGVGVP